MYLNYTEKVKQEAAVVSPIQIDIPVGLMTFTESTPLEGVRASLVHAPGHGCNPEDYPEHVNGKIALVERGDCAFGQKAYAAGQAGAEALLIYNNEDGSLSGTLGQDFPPGAPTAGISKEDGDKLIRLLAGHDKIELRVAIVEKREERLTYNVIAETKVELGLKIAMCSLSANPFVIQGGDKSNVIVIGGHSDSVHAGPGINDNGSGTAALLEISHLFRNVEPVNAVRFCWWTAEGIQSRIICSYYVANV